MTLHAVIELMGHRTRAGAISDAQMGGATLLRIEHPTRADHTGAEPLAEYYASAAIFSIRPCSEEEATKVAAWAWSEPVSRPALGPALAELIDDDDQPSRSEMAAVTTALLTPARRRALEVLAAADWLVEGGLARPNDDGGLVLTAAGVIACRAAEVELRS